MVHNTQNIDSITVQFYVNSKTKFGENVYICGSCPQLGNWTPHAGIKLETNRKNYPQWQTTRPMILRSNMFVEFKACIIRDSLVLWENLPQNRLIFTGSKPAQVYINFDSAFMEVYEKNVVQIECRNGIDSIMNDIQSDWGSSIGHPSNYPLERYHMVKREDQTFNRSQVSSNLMSATDSEEIQLQMKILNHFYPRSLVKTLSKPSQFEWKRQARKINEIRLNMNIIPQGSETAITTPKRRSYRSLPKDYYSPQKAIFESRVQARKSFPLPFGTIVSKEKSRVTHRNAESLNSQKKAKSDDKTMKASMFSQQSDSREQKSEFEDQVEDLFGFEIF